MRREEDGRRSRGAHFSPQPHSANRAHKMCVCVRGHGGRRTGGGHEAHDLQRKSTHIKGVRRRTRREVDGRRSRGAEHSSQPHSAIHIHKMCVCVGERGGRRSGGGHEAQNLHRSHILSSTHIKCLCVSVCVCLCVYMCVYLCVSVCVTLH